MMLHGAQQRLLYVLSVGDAYGVPVATLAKRIMSVSTLPSVAWILWRKFDFE